MAFLVPILHVGRGKRLSLSASRPKGTFRTKQVRACEPPATNAKSPCQSQFLLPPDIIENVVSGTMLEGQVLARVYSSSDNGFCNESFFESQMLLGGVPSLLLGQTTAGRAFGGYTANGFLARDDYREASTEKAMFVFTVSEDQVLVAANTDNVQYDFFDYAVRFGAGLLGIPMNPDKHIMKANMGTSSCRLPDGSTSVFGEFGMAALDHIEVLVAQKYLDEVERAAEAAGRSFFARLFG